MRPDQGMVVVRVLFASLPVRSHIGPMLPLAAAAAHAGHEVVFVTGPDAVRWIEDAGLTAVPAGLPAGELARRYGRAFAAETLARLAPGQRLEHLVLHALIGIAAPEMADDLVPLAQAWRPDLVIGNLAEWAGEVAATVVGVPHVVHGFGPPKSQASRPAVRAALGKLHARWGVDAARADSHVTDNYLDIWPAGARTQAGPWAYPNSWPLRPDHALPLSNPWPRPAVLDGLPYDRTVYVTAGTTHNTTPGCLETMVEALHGEGVNVVVTIGLNGDRDRLGPQPDHVRIERYIPQDTLLPHCDAIVCNAGAGTVLGSLAHAKPLVMAPVAADQHEIAAQIVQAGAGAICPTRPISRIEVRDALRAIRADPAYGAAAARLGEQIHSMPAPAEVVAKLETLVPR